MPDAYALGEGRFLQNANSLSGANALFASLGPVPRNRVWTILSALAYCSVAETQTYWFAIISLDTNRYPVTAPASASIAPAVTQWYPMLREGMELKLYPGESLYALRAAATAGSCIGLYIRYIDSQLPLYEEVEPQQQRKRISSVPSNIGRGIVARTLPGSSPGSGGGGGGGGTPPPVY
ncbi:MAG TPA: hypothetical protein PK967_20440 [Candidatus Hydrogenedentes bacterium]|jgi:hypothetical protein|nr:hypothetical protein [Candidatus Hydrogenedentota bacterium]